MPAAQLRREDQGVEKRFPLLTQNIYNCFRLVKSREIPLNLFYKTASGISAILENGAEGNLRFNPLFLWFTSLHLVICVILPRDLRLITA